MYSVKCLESNPVDSDSVILEEAVSIDLPFLIIAQVENHWGKFTAQSHVWQVLGEDFTSWQGSPLLRPVLDLFNQSPNIFWVFSHCAGCWGFDCELENRKFLVYLARRGGGGIGQLLNKHGTVCWYCRKHINRWWFDKSVRCFSIIV